MKMIIAKKEKDEEEELEALINRNGRCKTQTERQTDKKREKRS